MSLWLATITPDGALLVTDSIVTAGGVRADGPKYWQLPQARAWIGGAAALRGVQPPPAQWPAPSSWADGRPRTFDEACEVVAEQMASGQLSSSHKYHLALIAPPRLARIDPTGIRNARVGDILAGGFAVSATVGAAVAPTDLASARAVLVALAEYAIRGRTDEAVAFPIRVYTWRTVTEEILDEAQAAAIATQFAISPTPSVQT